MSKASHLVLCLYSLATVQSQIENWSITQSNDCQPTLRDDLTTQLHFYFHDIVSGSNPSAVKIAQSQTISPTSFGSLMMADDLLTEGPEPTSKVVGHAQGLYGSADQRKLGLLMAMSFEFTDGVYNGSTLSVMGRNAAMESPRVIPVVGGTGVFKMARGEAEARTVSLNNEGDAVVEYTVTVVHKKTTPWTTSN